MPPEPPKLRTRRELAAFLDDALSRRLGVSRVLTPDSAWTARNALKIFLIESHLPSEPHARAAALEPAASQLGFTTEISADDPDFVTLRFGSSSTIWIDVSLPRFWRAYCLGTVSDVKRTIRSLVRSIDGLDHVWLATPFLEKIPTWLGASITAFAIHSDRRKVTLRKQADALPIAQLTVRLWGTGQEDRLEAIRRSELFRGATALRSIRVRRGRPGADDGEYLATEFFSDGRVTAYGDSFDRLNSALLEVLDKYKAVVCGFEDQFGFGCVRTSEGAHHVRGRPIEFSLAWHGVDPSSVMRKVFSGTGPFALFGEPQRLAPSRWQVQAIDLHMRQRLTFDFSQNAARICLPRDVCGNTVVRFVGNLQRHLSSDTQLLELVKSA